MAERQRIAFVTGAASGLGLGACERLAAEGHAIVRTRCSESRSACAERAILPRAMWRT
jgi:NAD(P)-dependent dehydrogenase (short-subunit alcohol dehydrogenase family)